MHTTTSTLIALGLFTASVNAHGYVTGFRINGDWNPGYNPACTDGTAKNCEPTAGWTITNKVWGPVLPDDYSKPDIICNYDAHPAAISATAPAGANVDFVWNTWPAGHTGPIITAIAACNGSCSTVDPTELAFAPFDQKGIISGTNPGKWTTDTMLNNNKTYSVQLPSNLKPGNYVLRTEIIALFASKGTGTQNYPQCINLEVTGNGNAEPAGTPAMDWYKKLDPGLYCDIFTDDMTSQSYSMPGPALWDSSKAAPVSVASSSSMPASSAATSTMMASSSVMAPSTMSSFTMASSSESSSMMALSTAASSMMASPTAASSMIAASAAASSIGAPSPMSAVPAVPSSASVEPQAASSAQPEPFHGTPPTYGSAQPKSSMEPKATPPVQPQAAPSAQPAAQSPVQPQAAPSANPTPSSTHHHNEGPFNFNPHNIKSMPEGTTKEDLLVWLAIALNKVPGEVIV